MGKFTLGYQVLSAVLLGIFVGLFFGPLCAVLQPIAMTFTTLLQLMVLPYILFSLIYGLGSMSTDIGKKLFKCGWPFLLAAWAIMYFLLGIIAQLLPKTHETIVSISETQKPSNLLEQFITYIVPENFFYDFENNIIPSIAIFGLIVGIAIMHMEKKEPIIGLLERTMKVIDKILYWLALVSPIGAFAHISLAVGTVRFEDLYKIEFFVVCYIVLAVFVTFWVLPLLVSCLTPMSFKEVLQAFRKVCLLPFVTGLTPFAIPFLNSYLRDLGKDHESTFHETSQTILPLAYSFGQLGNCIALLFIFFLSFYYRNPFSFSEIALISLLTVPLSIGTSSSTLNSVSFMIDQFDFPHEAFVLFTETSAVTVNFQVLVSIAAVLSLILLTLHAYYGTLQVKWGNLISKLGTTIAIFCALILSFKPLINIADNFKNFYLDLKLGEVIADPVSTEVFTEIGVEEGSSRDSNRPALEQIFETKVLKVGYNQIDTPYAYENIDGQIVGYDIAYAYQLARDLDCKLELIRCNLDKLHEELQAGRYDIAMSSILMTESRILNLTFTHPYLEDNVVLVVPSSRKREFLNISAIQAKKGLKIASVGENEYFFKRHFSEGSLVELGNEDFCIGCTRLEQLLMSGEADAWITTKRIGYAWCLVHPTFTTIDYEGLIGKAYLSYPIADQSPKFTSFLNNWLLLKELTGFQKEMSAYWFEGEAPKQQSPRWSILRNVFHVGK